MRVNFFSQTGNINTGLNNGTTGTFTGPLVLAGNPIGPLEAAPKQYVDSAISALNANNIKAGTLNASRLPGFTGEVSSATGSGIFILNETGVPAGTYTKVTVNAKGRVISGANITVNDIPPFSWSKITTGKPNTIAGYGITDAISTNGCTLQGNITQTGIPSNNLDVVTKSYVDSKANSTAGNTTGNIIRRPISTTPSGYLRCNGGEVNKTMYSGLYSIIGDQYSNYAIPGGGKPWYRQAGFNKTQVADVIDFENHLAPVNLTGFNFFKTSKYVYAVGGISDTYAAEIRSDGTLKPWSQVTLTGSTIPTYLRSSTAIVLGSNVYILGGTTNSSGAVETKKIFKATINADGTITAWSDYSTIPGAGSSVNAGYVVTSSRVYIIGGYYASSGSWTKNNNVIYTTYDANGVLGLTWTTDTTLPQVLEDINTIYTGKMVYIFGRYGSSRYAYQTTVDTNGVIGTWATSSINSNIQGENDCIIGYINDKVYVTGGTKQDLVYVSAGNYYTNTYYSQETTAVFDINTTTGVITYNKTIYLSVGLTQGIVITIGNKYHILGAVTINDPVFTWKNNVNTPRFDLVSAIGPDGFLSALGLGNCNPYNTGCDYFVTKNFIYTLAGNSTNVIYSAPINTDGSIGTWGVNASTLPVNATGSEEIVVTKNYVYVLCFSGTSTTYKAPINADGTLGAWTTGTSLPYALTHYTAFITSNRIFLVAGNLSSATTNVYSAPINSDGVIGTWTLSSNSFPVAINSSNVILTRNRVYALGGQGASLDFNIYVANINNDGTIGTWSNSGLMVPYVRAAIVSTDSKVYLFGGLGSSSAVNDQIYRANINADGTISSFSYVGRLVGGVIGFSDTKAVITANKLHIFGASYAYIIGSSNYLIGTFLGGSNDYSPYYDGSILPTATTSFRLPDFTTTETSNEYYYIKY